MAILDGFAHVEVTIEVDGEPLHEHQESDIIVEPPHRTLRYIEAKNDEAFEIVLTVKKGTRFIGDCIAFDMHVDGEHIGGPIIWKGDCDEDDISVVEDGRPGPRNSVQKFRFSGLEIGEADRALPDNYNRLEGLGTILINFQDCDAVRKVENTFMPKKRIRLEAVSEKAVKGTALSHSIEYGAPEARADDPVAIYETKPVNRHEQKCGIEFRYRSLHSLRALHIIPMPPPLEERDPASLSLADRKELLKRYKESLEREERMLVLKLERRRPKLTVRVGDQDVELVDLTQD